MRSLLIACLLLAGGCALEPPRSAASPLQPALNALLQGDALEALRIFDATCGVAQTGGWAKPDALYAVRASYDLASEEFRVSYLAHEGQHFADYARYPMLEQPELEYRAKLTEIALSTTTTATLLANFASLGGDSRDSPHAFAARRVTIALQGVPMERVREAAVEKLRDSTASLERLGPEKTKRFLPD
jgi:hypothetical protein